MSTPQEAPDADPLRFPEPERPWSMRRRLAAIIVASLLAWALLGALALLVRWALRG